MILTLFHGHRCVRNINCKLHVWDPCPLSLIHCVVATFIEKTVHNVICVLLGCVFEGDNMLFFFVGQVSGFVENFSIRIYNQTP